MVRARRFLYVGLVWMALCVALAWWLLPQYRVAIPPDQPDAWTLPALPQPQIEAVYSRLAERSPWGKIGAAGQSAVSAADASWQLRGIVRKGKVFFALIEVDGKVERYAEGGQLPDGQHLSWIGPGAVVSVGDEGEARRSLYEGIY